MTSLGVGLLGCGFVGFRHAASIREVSSSTDLPVRLVAVCDRRPERAQAFSHSFEVPVASDHRRLIASPGVDAVYVCTPTDTHLPLVEMAASVGKAIFCEKPLGRNLEEARRLVEVVERAGVPNQVGLVLRSSVVYRAVASLLGELGELMAVVFRDDQHWPLEAHYGSTWRSDRRVVGSGTLLEHSIHDLDLIRWLFGDPCRVAAAVGNHAGRPGVEDAAVALLEIRQGPVVTLTSLWHEMAGRRSERSLEALGRRGRLRVEADFWGALEWQGEEGAPRVFGPEEVLEMAAHHHGWDETERRLARVAPLEDYWFLRSLSTGAAPAPSMAEGLAAHQLVDRIYQAAKSSSSS